MKSIPYTKLYEKMYLIRRFESRLLELFSRGKLFGTTHTYVGQEAVAVSVISHLRNTDIVFSSHRCHGHYLAKEDDPEGLLAEIMGREGGICAGRGGSQHLCRNNFFSNYNSQSKAGCPNSRRICISLHISTFTRASPKGAYSASRTI